MKTICDMCGKTHPALKYKVGDRVRALSMQPHLLEPFFDGLPRPDYTGQEGVIVQAVCWDQISSTAYMVNFNPDPDGTWLPVPFRECQLELVAVGPEVRVDSRLELVTFASELYGPMLNGWLRSVPADCCPMIRVFSAGPVTYAQGDWHRVMEKKLDLILEQITLREEWSIFVVSDVDVQFFQPFADDIRTLMKGHDVLFQHDRGTRHPPVLEWLCAGFMVIRAVPASWRLFERARLYLRLKDDPAVDDQVALRLVTADEREARLGLLPPRYWTNGAPWAPGLELDPPGDIVMHHANWIVGNDTKLVQLREVREIVERRRHG